MASFELNSAVSWIDLIIVYCFWGEFWDVFLGVHVSFGG